MGILLVLQQKTLLGGLPLSLGAPLRLGRRSRPLADPRAALGIAADFSIAHGRLPDPRSSRVPLSNSGLPDFGPQKRAGCGAR